MNRGEAAPMTLDLEIGLFIPLLGEGSMTSRLREVQRSNMVKLIYSTDSIH